MNPQLWKKSQRGFPFNIPLNGIILACLLIPFALTMVLFDPANHYLWKVYLFTLALSVLGYIVAEKAIDQFKESLEKAGLFGKDLNKAGVKEDKPRV